MPKRIELRPVTVAEKTEIGRLAKATSKPLRRVKRARIIAVMLADPTVAFNGSRCAGGLQWCHRSQAHLAMTSRSGQRNG